MIFWSIQRTYIGIWVNTILNDMDTRVIWPRYEGPCIVYRPKWYQKRDILKHPYLTHIKKCEILILDIQMVSQKDSSTLVRMFSFYSSFKNKSSLRLLRIVKWHWAHTSQHDLIVDAYLWTPSLLLSTAKIQLYRCMTPQVESFLSYPDNPRVIPFALEPQIGYLRVLQSAWMHLTSPWSVVKEKLHNVWLDVAYKYSSFKSKIS